MISGNERVPFLTLLLVMFYLGLSIDCRNLQSGFMVPSLIHSFAVGQSGGIISFSPHSNLAASSAAHFTFALAEEEEDAGIMGRQHQLLIYYSNSAVIAEWRD